MSVYAENAKLNFSYDRRFLAISADLERKRAKKSVDTHINFHLYHYAGNNPVKYVDPDGEYVITKNKDTGLYNLGSFRNGIGKVHYATKALSNFIPFGGYAVNLEKPLSVLDPTANSKILFNSDDCNSIVNLSNEFDSFGFTETAKNSKLFKVFGLFMAAKGLQDVYESFKNDGIINDFMKNQDSDLFAGCQTDKDAINLGNYLANGALFYNKNEVTMNEKGISKSAWGKLIRQSTNNSCGDSKFESYIKLMNE